MSIENILWLGWSGVGVVGWKTILWQMATEGPPVKSNDIIAEDGRSKVIYGLISR